MHLSSADKKAAQDGFKFLVLSPSGARKCYCTSVKEAKREAGKGGKIVSLGRMRYTTQNPRKRNPTARMVGLQRNPWSTAGLNQRHRPVAWIKFYTDAKRNSHAIEVEQYTWGDFQSVINDHNLDGSSYQKQAIADMARLHSGSASELYFRILVDDKHVRELPTLRVSHKERAAALRQAKAMADEYAAREKWKAAAQNPSARMVGLQRNPTWTTAAILAGGAYIYGRSAKVREKIKGAIDSAHKKLENPTARMVGMQRNPGFPVSSPPVSKLVKELGITVEEAKHIKALASQGKPKTALKYANDAISRGHYLAHGVESLYPEFPHFYYVNMGDTYDTTLYYDGKALRIGDWGSYVERHSR